MFVPADPAGGSGPAADRSMEEKRALYAAVAKKVRGFIYAAPASTTKDEDDEALAPSYYHELAGFYVEAARRLPIADIPYLANCISIGGLAVGIADPVTNIIITTINAFALRPLGGLCVPPLKRDDALEKTRKKSTFAAGAHSSRAGLVAFLTCYFRNLTEDQAKKLLDMAGHNLPRAIHLLQASCCEEIEAPLHPGNTRAKTALRQAEKNARGSMAGDLVRLMTWRYPLHHLEPVMDVLRARGKPQQQLTPDCVYKISVLLRCSWPPQPTPAPTPGTRRDTSGNVTTVVMIRKDLFATTTISKDLVTTTTITSTACPSDDGNHLNDDDCVHLPTNFATDVSVHGRVCSLRENPDFLPVLKMSLLHTVHGFYIDALGMLPTHALRDHHLLRSILAAGHCYGPLDAVSNIIVNSIWYHAAFPLSEDVSNLIGGAADILDARSLSRVESRSLDGLVAFICYTYSISEQQAVAQLCEHRYDISYAFQSGGSPEKTCSGFAAAALVSKHPQPAAFGDFLTSLIPAKCDRLYSLIQGNGLDFVLSGDTLELLKNVVTGETTAGVVAAAAAAVPSSRAPDDLGRQSALETLSIRRETFKSDQDYVRTKLENLLLDYGRDKGSFYKLGIVCGVTTERYGFYSCCYHVNFLASRDADPNDDDSTRSSGALFFAEFWNMVDCQVEHSTNVPFCCPVGESFDAYSVRCSICDHTSCHIAHPSCAEYVYFTGSTEYDFPVHHDWGSDLDEMLESDFIYFDGKSDDDFAKIILSEEESSSSSPRKPRAREESTSFQRNTRARTGDGIIGALAPFRN